MVEEKLSKINATIPKVEISSSEKNKILLEAKTLNDKKFFVFNKRKLIPIICSLLLVIVAVILVDIIYDKYKAKIDIGYDDIDKLIIDNEYCEKIYYEEWMADIKFSGNNNNADMPEPTATIEAYFRGFGMYDVAYSNEPGYYLVVYVNSKKVKKITSLHGCLGFECDIKDFTNIDGSVTFDYKKNLDNLVFIKCTNEEKIPSNIIGVYYPIQVCYVNNMFVKEEVYSKTVINKNYYFATPKSYTRTNKEYLIPDAIPDDAVSIENVLKGKSAFIISDNLEDVLSKEIINLTPWCHENQLFYNDYVVFSFWSLGLYYFYDIEYDLLLDENTQFRSSVSNQIRVLIEKIRNNFRNVDVSKHIYYYKSDHIHYYYDFKTHLYNKEMLTYLTIEDYKTILYETCNQEKVKYHINVIDNLNQKYDAGAFDYTYKIIFTYEEYLKAANYLKINCDYYDEKFFEASSIVIMYNKNEINILKSQSILNIIECENDNTNNHYEYFSIIEFDKADVSLDDYLTFIYKKI